MKAEYANIAEKPFIYAAVAQLAELVPSKHDVAGSSPVDGSIQFQNDFAMKGVVAWGMLIR